MRALKFRDIWDISLDNVAELHCEGPDDVVVELDYCGICGTDVGIVTGSYAVAVSGTTLGHESTGRVVEKGDNVKHLALGDRVVINPTYSCGECRLCRIGNPNHCERKMGTEAGVSYDGCFADRYRAHGDYMIKLDDHVDSRAAALTEPLSCVITGVDALHLVSTEARTLVIGAGPMGLLYLWELYRRGLQPALIERSDQRRRFAEQVLPPGSVLYADLDSAMAAEYGASDALIDIAVDTSGHLAKELFERLARGGKLLNVALKRQFAELNMLHIADKSLSVLGSIDSLNNSFERAYHAIRDGEIPALKMVSHTLALEDYQQGFALIGCDVEKRSFSVPDQPSAKVLLDMTVGRH
ncbi:putative zinc-type alcohol dehydrogenase-like protein YdjJ [Carnimonas sp. R-84981]|uniref:zinc-dependent alcohol dehydrogenase n=1 Tax=Carnimonas bestiolae TaxID=3402172 RepID=UPI003EDBA2F0